MILEIRHSQVMFKYRQWRKKNRTIMEEQISPKNAGSFNQCSDISRGYKHLTFDSFTDPLTTKQSISSSPPALTAPLSPIDESAGDMGDSGEKRRKRRVVLRRHQVNLGSHRTTQHTPAPPGTPQACRADSKARRASVG